MSVEGDYLDKMGIFIKTRRRDGADVIQLLMKVQMMDYMKSWCSNASRQVLEAVRESGGDDTSPMMHSHSTPPFPPPPRPHLQIGG
ncbi:hypothetical protein Acr_19g0003940 [Actinidia rufa]|uniref:Uncharacterized protein n=1 Tax=Actinidia rufa TaxID=165716 RepID=A0A7J0G9H7_9ERIC|nr:hypothetical protein Acr_19g0003940 [Actinidia rufa]